jgi:hypothetical protein
MKNKKTIRDLPDEEKQRVAGALFGTVLEYGTYAEGVKMIPPKSESKVIRSRCTYCSDKKGWKIRNRNFSTGVYSITKVDAEEFAKVGGFKLPPESMLRGYIIITNFCGCCGKRKRPRVELIKFTDFLTKFPQFQKYHPLSR